MVRDPDWGSVPQVAEAHTLLRGSTPGWWHRVTTRGAQHGSTPSTQVPRLAKESLCTEHYGELAKPPTRSAENQAGLGSSTVLSVDQ